MMKSSEARQRNFQVQSQPLKKEKQVIIKVHKQKWLTKGEKFLYSLFGISLIIACFIIVAQASATDTINRDIQSLENDVNQQQINNENYLFEIRELSKPERISRIAKENGLKIQDSQVKQANRFNN